MQILLSTVSEMRCAGQRYAAEFATSDAISAASTNDGFDPDLLDMGEVYGLDSADVIAEAEKRDAYGEAHCVEFQILKRDSWQTEEYLNPYQ